MSGRLKANAIANGAITTLQIDSAITNSIDSAANTVTVSQNGGSTLDATKLNFVNTDTVTVTVTAGSGAATGNANVSFTAAGLPKINIVTGTDVTAVVSQHYALTNTAQTSVTLPASPSSGDVVWVTVENGLANNIILTNGNKIKGLSDNLVIDIANVGIQLRYVDANVGWTIN